jgi:hypothetical protein
MRQKSGPRCGAEQDAVAINSMLGAAAGKRLLEAWRRMPDLYFGPETSDA